MLSWGFWRKESECLCVCVCWQDEEGSTYMGGGSKGQWELGVKKYYSFKNALERKRKSNMAS